ncbi:5-formyltetrahydrofolate cyclo-ligase [Thiolapillus brandeum]|uniref:5-formyltetrahydrofolate cyclo-ligase n=1 Tax=Thiolapillus brandeum TaxID=1076588 RepID=A0A7U6GGB4_9GAMM|nr:5-formyltetrahydrofolate cyclo-ligase [Thiolapillus brandeum]BAO43091.1 5-formyltetrahydrofolate cyclo-ligase [Thiolapillus brandeum]
MNPSLDQRRRIRARRRKLDPAYRRAAATAACKQLLSLNRFQSARRVALYLAADGELDPLPVLRKACAMGKHCYLPVLHPVREQSLWFVRWQPGEALHPNRYGIAEPRWKPQGLVKPWALDLVLMPLVAFDEQGNRMGMGGGYYDRSFAWRFHRHFWKGPELVGYAYELQKLTRIRASKWDVPMDAIVTESTVYMG